MPQYFVTSSLDAIGKEGVLEYIDSVNQEIFKNNDSFI
jgi:GTP-binding protein